MRARRGTRRAHRRSCDRGRRGLVPTGARARRGAREFDDDLAAAGAARSDHGRETGGTYGEAVLPCALDAEREAPIAVAACGAEHFAALAILEVEVREL